MKQATRIIRAGKLDPKLTALRQALDAESLSLLKVWFANLSVDNPDVLASLAEMYETDTENLAKALDLPAPAGEPNDATSLSASRKIASNGHRATARGRGLQGAELETMQRAMGTFKAATPATPYRKPDGSLVLPTTTPTEARRLLAQRGGR